MAGLAGPSAGPPAGSLAGPEPLLKSPSAGLPAHHRGGPTAIGQRKHGGADRLLHGIFGDFCGNQCRFRLLGSCRLPVLTGSGNSGTGLACAVEAMGASTGIARLRSPRPGKAGTHRRVLRLPVSAEGRQRWRPAGPGAVLRAGGTGDRPPLPFRRTAGGPAAVQP